MITADVSGPKDSFLSGKPWGVEDLTVAERHYKLLAGVDQFGGNNEIEPVLEAYKMGVREHGEAYMRERFEQSAVRLLKICSASACLKTRTSIHRRAPSWLETRIYAGRL